MSDLFLRQIIWWLCNLDLWLIIFFIGGAFLLWTRWWTGGRFLLSFSALILAFTCISPVPDFIATYMENQFERPTKLPDDIKGFIIIGFGIDRRVTQAREMVTFNCAAQREVSLIELYKKYPDKQFIYTGGGFKSDSTKSLAEIVKQFFKDMTGEEPDNLLFEDQAQDTRENAKYTYELVNPKVGEKWVLVTSALNMPRAIGTFKKAGWDSILPYPVDYRTIGRYDPTFNLSLYHGMKLWSTMAYEIVGLIFYYFAGYIDELIPSPEPSKNEL